MPDDWRRLFKSSRGLITRQAATGEGTITDSRHRLGDDDAFQARAAHEGEVANLGHRVGDSYPGQALASIKS